MSNYRDFSFTDQQWLILRERKTYSRTASGKCWRPRPDETERNIFNATQYTNFITAIPFFNNWGDGAYCRAQHSYEPAGYLPTTVITVGPGRETKHVDTFRFLYLPDMRRAAGFREKHIIEAAREWRVFPTAELKGWTIELITDPDEDGHRDSAVYDTFNLRWVN